MSLLAGANYRMYSNVDDDNLEDRGTQYLLFAGNRRNPRMSLGLDGSYRRDDLMRRVLVLDAPLGGAIDVIGDDPVTDVDQGTDLGGEGDGDIGDDANQDPDVDTGSTRDQVRRERLSLSPSIGFTLSPRSRVNLAYTYYSLEFDADDIQVIGGGIQDSETNSVRGDYRYALSERTELGFTLMAAQFEPEISPDSDVYEATLDINRQITERDTLSIRIGGRITESDVADEDGGVLSVVYNRRTDTGSVYGSIERQMYPSAYGDLVETDRIALGWRRSLSARWSMNIQGQAFSTTGSQNGNRDRDYFSIRPDVRWAMTEALSLGMYYQYRWVDQENVSGDASGNSVGLSLNFTPPRRI